MSTHWPSAKVKAVLVVVGAVMSISGWVYLLNMWRCDAVVPHSISRFFSPTQECQINVLVVALMLQGFGGLLSFLGAMHTSTRVYWGAVLLGLSLPFSALISILYLMIRS
jgi:hypothetical protein